MHACRPAPDEPSSRPAEQRVESVCLPDDAAKTQPVKGQIAVTALAQSTVGEPGGRVRKEVFPRTARLLQASDFKSVFKNNTASSDRYFRILFRPNSGPENRLGMAVSRKIDPKAVGRNRIKRVTRESFRSWCARQTQTENARVDVVVLPRPEAAEAGNAELFSSLDRHWSRISSKADTLPAPATGKLKDKD